MYIYHRIKESIWLETKTSEFIKSKLSLLSLSLSLSCKAQERVHSWRARGPRCWCCGDWFCSLRWTSPWGFLTPSHLFWLAVCCHLAEIFLLLLESAPDSEPESCQSSWQMRGNKCWCSARRSQAGNGCWGCFWCSSPLSVRAMSCLICAFSQGWKANYLFL